MSVEQVTDNLAAATVNDSTTTAVPSAGDGPNATQNPEAVIAVVDEGRRLYIGNLAYATTEGDLATFFEGYLVESTSIPINPRTQRPVGYAFVDLATATEAQRAITELSGKEVLSRKVSVQLARRPDDKKEGEQTNAEGATSGGEGRKRAPGRGRGRGRGRGGRSGRGGRAANGEAEPLADTTAQSANTQNIESGAAAATAEATPAATSPKENKPKTPRAPKQRGPPEDGIPSKTKVMVANLPYDLSEDKLKELFAAYEPQNAKIALRPIPRFMVKKLQARNEARKGRGFGFVTLASEELQQKAVAEMDKKEIEGREIAVKVAIDSPGKEDVDPEAAGVAPITENGVVQANDPPAETTTA